MTATTDTVVPQEKPSTRPRTIVPSTCYMCRIWRRIFFDLDCIAKTSRVEPDESAILGDAERLQLLNASSCSHLEHMMADSPAAGPDCHSRGSLVMAALPKRPPREQVRGTLACVSQLSPRMLPLRDR